MATAWFTPSEFGRLEKLGYRLVALSDCLEVRRSAKQLIIARRRPFRSGGVIVPWPSIDREAQLDPWKQQAAA